MDARSAWSRERRLIEHAEQYQAFRQDLRSRFQRKTCQLLHIAMGDRKETAGLIVVPICAIFASPILRLIL